MPKIPEIARPGLSLEVPGAQVNRGGAGAAGEGLARLGSAMADVSLDLAQKIKISEAKVAVHSNLLEDGIAADDYMHELKMKYPTGYVTDEFGNAKKDESNRPIPVSDEFNRWANERYKKKQLAMPSEMAQEEYRLQAAEQFGRSALKIKGEERLWQIDYYEKQRKQNIQKAKDIQAVRPNASLAVEQANLLIKEIDASTGIYHNPVEAKQKKLSDVDDLMDTYFRGEYQTSLDKRGPTRVQHVDRVIGKLRAAPGKDANADGLLPENRTEWIERFIRLRKEAQRMDMDDVRAGVRNNLAAMARGDTSLATFKSAIVGVDTLSTDQETGQKKPNILAEGISNAVLTREAARFDNDFNWAAGSQAERAKMLGVLPARVAENNKLIKDAGIVGVVPGGGQDPLKTVEDALKHDNEARTAHQQRDPVGYTVERLNRFPNVRPVVALDAALRSGRSKDALSMLLKQNPSAVDQAFATANSINERAGVKPAFLSMAASKSLGDELQNFKNTDEANATVITLRGALGTRFAPVVTEMIQRGHLPEEWMSMAALSDDPVANKDIVFSLLGAKAVDKRFSALPDDVRSSLGQVSYSSESSRIAASMLRGNVQNLVLQDTTGQMLKAINIKAKQLMADNGMSAKDAIKKAEALFTDRFVKVFDNENEELYLPKMYKARTPVPITTEFTPEDARSVRSYLTRYLSSKAKDDIRPFDENLAGMFERQISKGTFVFTWDKNGTPGVALQIPGNLNGNSDVVSYRAVDKKTGQMIFWPMDKLIKEARADKNKPGSNSFDLFMGDVLK